MKLKLFVTLIACAYAYGATDFLDEISDNRSADNDFQNSHFELNLLSPDHEISADDQLLISELSSLQDRSFIADTIKKALEDLRVVVVNGNDDIPPLDPLVIPRFGPYYYMITGVRASAAINNFRLEGLRWYVVDYVNFNALRLTLGLQVTIPWLTFTGNYEANAAVLLINHNAGGNYRIFINRMEVGVDMRLGTNILGGGHLVLRELNIKIDIFDTQIRIDGMTGSSLINNFISAYVQNLTQDLIQNEMNNVSKIISEELFEIINDILKDYTLNDIMGF